MLKLTQKQMIDAMRHNDSNYDGRFIVGVHSTGIYCLPSCRARLPLVKNVKFYPSRKAARSAGLRACKRCRPDDYPHVQPDWLPEVLAHMRSHPQTRLTEQSLADVARVDITTIRRYFRSHHQTTPLAYHRRIRLEHARELIRSGMDYLSAAYECGYESASGFRDAFVRQFGQSPGSLYER